MKLSIESKGIRWGGWRPPQSNSSIPRFCKIQTGHSASCRARQSTESRPTHSRGRANDYFREKKWPAGERLRGNGVLRRWRIYLLTEAKRTEARSIQRWPRPRTLPADVEKNASF